jgi:predicted GTPase
VHVTPTENRMKSLETVTFEQKDGVGWIRMNRPKELRDSYLRYLSNGFRREWGFEGSPVRLRPRQRREERG